MNLHLATRLPSLRWRLIQDSSIALLVFSGLSVSDFAFAADGPASFSISGEPLTDLPAVTVVKKVEALERRQNDVTDKTVVGKTEIQQYADSNLSDVLNRQPGVSSSGGNVRMRGLGIGYVQILIDGVAAPVDFAIDSIAPDSVERIEIMPTGTAEFGARAIAGTINIVLKRSNRGAVGTFKLGGSYKGSGVGPAVGLSDSGKAGAFTYSISADASQDFERDFNGITDSAADGSGKTTEYRKTAERYDSRITRYDVAPQIDWTVDGGNALTWKGSAERREIDFNRARRESDLVGGPTEYPVNDWSSSSSINALRSDAEWVHSSDDGSKLSVKLGGQYQRRVTNFFFVGFDPSGEFALDRIVPSNATDETLTSIGKYSRDIGESHRLDLGWDGSSTRRNESRQQYDFGPGNALVDSIDEAYLARIRRVAFYGQDVWQVTPELSAYYGLRWEGLDTRVTGNSIAEVDTNSSVVSPVAQVLWQIPGAGKEQIRLSLAHTYSAPSPQNLVPRRYTVNNDNGPTNPDFQGNPTLRPELAWGLDLAFEHYFGTKGLVSLTGYAKSIKDVVLQTLYQQNGVWITSPVNGGNASAHGLTIQTKIPLSNIPGVLETLLRFSLTRNWSQVSNVPGPYNHLADQTPITANFGIDQAVSPTVSLGADFSYRSTAHARQSAAWLTTESASRVIDAHVLWTFTPGTRIRFAVHRTLPGSSVDSSYYKDSAASSSRAYDSQTRLGAKVLLEIDR